MRLPKPSSLSFALTLSLLSTSQAAITVYNQTPFGHQVTSAAAAAPTLAAYDETQLIPPALPTEPYNKEFAINLQKDAGAVAGLSIPHKTASFFGFSIEMSVINQVLGKNSSFIQVPFLNLMANLQERAGHVLIRIGGNTQEYAVMVNELDNGKAIAKQKASLTQTTLTPAVLYTADLFYIAANISQFVNVNWFVGIPFNDTNWRLQIAEYSQRILGDKLVGMQVGNEPDLYARHGHRPESYTPMDYFNEFGQMIQALKDNGIPRVDDMLVGPSLASADWTPQMVWDTGFVTQYSEYLHALSVERYPNNNCAATFGVGAAQDPQENFPKYLTHNAGVNLCSSYLPSTMMAQQANKPFIMFETNSASCGGFPGISDTYGGALWAMDYGFQMAYSNFSNALIHIGGQNVYYNPFTAPPTNQSTFHQWTVGAIYYSVLVLAEAFGKTNTSQIVDLTSAIGANEFTPVYAIYENSALSKVALFNYVDDLGGTRGPSDLKVTLNVPSGTGSVRVKYLESASVSTKGNITWAGQTFGNKFEVDGRLKGSLNVVSITCTPSTTTADSESCIIPVPAPGFALVFLNPDDAFTSLGQASSTFTTTAWTKKHNTATVDPKVLETSNGHSGKDRGRFRSTSKGGAMLAVANGVGRGVEVATGAISVAVVVGSVVLGVMTPNGHLRCGDNIKPLSNPVVKLCTTALMSQRDPQDLYRRTRAPPTQPPRFQNPQHGGFGAESEFSSNSTMYSPQSPANTMSMSPASSRHSNPQHSGTPLHPSLASDPLQDVIRSPSIWWNQAPNYPRLDGGSNPGVASVPYSRTDFEEDLMDTHHSLDFSVHIGGHNARGSWYPPVAPQPLRGIRTGNLTHSEAHSVRNATFHEGSFAHARNIKIKTAYMIDYNRTEDAGDEETRRNLEMSRVENEICNKLVSRAMPSGMLDSQNRGYIPRCEEQTRLTIRNHIVQWAQDHTHPRCLFWLSGSAAVGKSAVAQTVAKTMKAKKLPVAVFFFSRPNGRSDPNVVIPTLMLQLFTSVPEYRHIITDKITRNPVALQENRDVQFQELIVEPFLIHASSRTASNAQKTFLIVLDGLDECSDRAAQSEFITIISRHARSRLPLPFKFLICSRPESHLKVAFSKPETQAITLQESLKIDDMEAQADAKRLLEKGFAEIRSRYPDQLTDEWPTPAQIRLIADRASGHLGFASFILRFIGDEKYDDPSSQLEVCIRFLERSRGPETSNPLHDLDLLYTQIFSDIPQNILPTTRRILAFFIFHQGKWNFWGQANFLGLTQASAYSALHRLHSVIAIPVPGHALYYDLRVHHLSFAEYLKDPARSGKFVLDNNILPLLLMITQSIEWLDRARGILHNGLPRSWAKEDWNQLLPKLTWKLPLPDSGDTIREMTVFSLSYLWRTSPSLPEDSLKDLIKILEKFDFDLDYSWWIDKFSWLKSDFIDFIRWLVTLGALSASLIKAISPNACAKRATHTTFLAKTSDPETYVTPFHHFQKQREGNMEVLAVYIELGVMLMGFARSFSDLLVARTMLGLTEGGLFLGVAYYITLWYRHHETGFRMAIFFSAATLAGAFGGLLATGISRMDGLGGRPGWSWIFVVEGLVTIGVALVAKFIITDDHNLTRFLTEEEKLEVGNRLKSDINLADEFALKYVFDALKDRKIWISTLALTAILKNLGYSSVKSQLMTVPPYVCGSNLLALSGTIMLISTLKSTVQYAGICMVICGNNVGGSTKWAVAIAIQAGFANVGGIVSSFSFRSSNAPHYYAGYGLLIGALLLSTCLALILHVHLVRENTRRDAIMRPSQNVAEDP
ncbi:hypothetical protein NP233_g4984 [Leucocoprinus birnbaumii]|uniref:Glycoside hydrolase family 79 protein n=1 Tax=Leucocoprinus birnbaumii TaxID=56174 RepID=A0AAD5VU58_9AGAR|nr:hypothetical protein NP233_g4984 [Leucocoprinus birnbaumii]